MSTGFDLALDPERATHADDGAGRSRPVLVWRSATPFRCVSSGALGGGLADRSWVFNAEVSLDYQRDDAAGHLRDIGAELGLEADAGTGLMTAARVLHLVTATDGGVGCAATVGVSTPTWAAAPDGTWSRWAPGTINLVCLVPVSLSDAALVNAVITATEAKTQALLDAGVPGTGTASDAVVVCCPRGGTEAYGGPRSAWGARLARSVHAAVADGTKQFMAQRA